MNKIIFAFCFLIFASGLTAQQMMSTDTNAVKTIGGIVNESLRLVSGQKGKSKNWDALRNLFLPTATFTVLNSNNDSISLPVETVSLNDFIELLHDDYYEDGYLEYETGKAIDYFNGIASVFQSFHGKDSNKKEAKGINSYQLVFFGNRWWIANLLWTLATDKIKIPRKYLRKN